jgi:hypothetical protein
VRRDGVSDGTDVDVVARVRTLVAPEPPHPAPAFPETRQTTAARLGKLRQTGHPGVSASSTATVYWSSALAGSAPELRAR